MREFFIKEYEEIPGFYKIEESDNPDFDEVFIDGGFSKNQYIFSL